MRCSPRISTHGHLRQNSPHAAARHVLSAPSPVPVTPRGIATPTVPNAALSFASLSGSLSGDLRGYGTSQPQLGMRAGSVTPPAPVQWGFEMTPRSRTLVSNASEQRVQSVGSPGPARRNVQRSFGTWSTSDSRGCLSSSSTALRNVPPSSPRPARHRAPSLNGRSTPGPPRTLVPGTPPPPSPRIAARRTGTSTPSRPSSLQPQIRRGCSTEVPSAHESRRRTATGHLAAPSMPAPAAAAPASNLPAVASNAKTLAAPQLISPPSATPPVALAPGVVVKVRDYTLRVTCALGEGSFGTVWGADCESPSGEVSHAALKEIPCHSQQALADAVFEGEILRALGPKMRFSASAVSSGRKSSNRPDLEEHLSTRIPSLIDMEVVTLGQESWQVRIAMSRVPGEPLSRFMEDNRPGYVVGRSERHRRFAEAVNYSRELVLQLAPAFERIATRAYHRDVTPRNILIETCEGDSGHRFGLIDFGLAVDSTQWRIGLASVPSLLQSDGTPAWQHFGVAGDGRYWPVASWYMFEMGAEKVMRCAGLELEYKMHLDLHSLGLSAVQVLVEMSPLHEASDAGGVTLQDSDDFDDEVLTRLWCLQTAWHQYWDDATRFWQCIYDTFRSGGDFKSLKNAYVRADVHETVRSSLMALRAALRQLREASARAPAQLGVRGLPSLVDALLAMVGAGEKDSAINWTVIRELLEAGEERRPVQTFMVNGKEAISPPSTASPVSPVSSVSVASSQTPSPAGLPVGVVQSADKAMMHSNAHRMMAAKAC